MVESTGLVAEQQALDALVDAVRGELSPGDERLVLLASSVAPTSFLRLRAINPDGQLEADGERFNSVSIPIEASIAIRKLRAASYRDGSGTWFGVRLTVHADGTAKAEYNYDDEPEWDAPVDPVVYVNDLKKFPRDEEHQPEWLRRKVAEATSA